MLTALDTSIFNVLFKGTVSAENDNYGEYAKASIYNNISSLSGQKMILMHGEKDMTIGKRQSEGLATYMQSVDEPVELILMPGEDHVYKKPQSFVLLCEKALQFVNRSGKSDCAI
jgi:dipeptidyl aminopeptidase/acylaminoacyl peptidase